MTFGVNDCEKLEKIMADKGIEKVESIKYLGVVVDSKLKMNSQADNIVTKVTQSMNAMNVIKRHLPTFSLMQFYNAFIGSHLFCNSFLLCRMNDGDVKRLQKIQNKALKTAFGLEMRFSTERLFMEFAVNVLPVIGIACFNLLLLTKKHILTASDEFEVINEGRRIKQLKFPRFHRALLANDLVCLGPKIYNQLPLELREISSYNRYKLELNTYLLKNKLCFLRGFTLNVNNIFNQ